ncbi:MAG: twin-arginine translocase subunit TatC, partial [Acidobacteriota bacterium]
MSQQPGDEQHGDKQHGEGLPHEPQPQHSQADDLPPVTFPDDPNSNLDPSITPPVPPKLDTPALTPEVIQRPKTAGSRNPPPPPPPKPEEPDEDEGMLRMSFMDHLEELRSRIIQILAGFGIAFVGCMYFAEQIWHYVDAPLRFALAQTGGNEIATGLTDPFTIKYMWVPFVASIYLSSPWLIYQLWSFISPGLYPRERKWAA